MTRPIMDQAVAQICAPAGLDRVDIARALGLLASGGADLGDLYFEARSSRSWRLEEGRVSGGSFAIQQGVGARVARGPEVAFAYSADLQPPALRALAETVRALSRGGGGTAPAPIALADGITGHALYPAIDPVAEADAARCIALLERVETQARAADPRIVRVDAHLVAHDHVVLVADLDGRLGADVRPMVQLRLTVVAEAKGRRARGHGGLGGRQDLAALEPGVASAIAAAVQMALVNLDARPAPAGVMPVVLGPGYPGVLFHEAVGHGLEADHHRQGLSVFGGRLGERIAAPGVTVVDDGGIAGRIGSLGMDDEGMAPERTVLVEDGILTGLLQDRLNAGLMHARPTGNGRRQSHAHLPMPRMTNTYLAAGTDDPADILRSVAHGIYATGFGGGQVDITSGRFNFSTTQAWRIENGRLTAPIDGATLIGVGHEALKQISMVGHDLALDEGIATCGKQGQTVDVSVGQPTIRIDAMMVGGRGA